MFQRYGLFFLQNGCHIFFSSKCVFQELRRNVFLQNATKHINFCCVATYFSQNEPCSKRLTDLFQDSIFTSADFNFPQDSKGLTPLYLSVVSAAEAGSGGKGASSSSSSGVEICETLLHDHAAIGAQDLQGWQEVHQVSK